MMDKIKPDSMPDPKRINLCKEAILQQMNRGTFNGPGTIEEFTTDEQWKALAEIITDDQGINGGMACLRIDVPDGTLQGKPGEAMSPEDEKVLRAMRLLPEPPEFSQ